ncbi:MAG: hypothetical protein AAFZ17_07535 [Cyanobacteria bacterium J06650_10]
MRNSYQTLCDTFQNNRRDRLVQHLSNHYHWPEPKAHRTVDEYVMFLYVASRHLETPLVPTQAIDYAWEADILQNTAQYMQTCESLCGKMIHHTQKNPLHTSPTSESVEAAFNQTQALFTRYFGHSVSGHAAACGVL